MTASITVKVGCALQEEQQPCNNPRASESTIDRQSKGVHGRGNDRAGASELIVSLHLNEKSSELYPVQVRSVVADFSPLDSEHHVTPRVAVALRISITQHLALGTHALEWRLG